MSKTIDSRGDCYAQTFIALFMPYGVPVSAVKHGLMTMLKLKHFPKKIIGPMLCSTLILKKKH